MNFSSRGYRDDFTHLLEDTQRPDPFQYPKPEVELRRPRLVVLPAELSVGPDQPVSVLVLGVRGPRVSILHQMSTTAASIQSGQLLYHARRQSQG